MLENDSSGPVAAIRYPDVIENALQRVGGTRGEALATLALHPPGGLTGQQFDDMVTAAAALRAEEIALTCVRYRRLPAPATGSSTAS